MGLSQIGFWTIFRISPNLVPLVQIKYPMNIFEEDKAIEVRSEIIRTRLGY